eukprot:123623_1
MNLIATAKNNLKKQVQNRLRKRISSMDTIINAMIPSICRRFVMDETKHKLICNKILNKVDEYNGRKKLQIEQKDTQENINQHARKWWNRQKALPLGAYLFSEILFDQLTQFIQKECTILQPLEQLILFISIFQRFIAHKIEFPKTKPKPLILQTCFYTDSVFKSHCFKFIKLFGDENIKWNPYTKMVIGSVENGKRIWQYQKNRNRCQTICNAFNECLDKILFKCKFKNDINIQLVNKWHKYLNASQKPAHTHVNRINRRINDHELSTVCTCNTHAAINNAFDFVFIGSTEKQNINMNNSGYGSNRTFQSTNNFAKKSTKIHAINKMELSIKHNRYERIEAHINNMTQSLDIIIFSK